MSVDSQMRPILEDERCAVCVWFHKDGWCERHGDPAIPNGLCPSWTRNNACILCGRYRVAGGWCECFEVGIGGAVISHHPLLDLDIPDPPPSRMSI